MSNDWVTDQQAFNAERAALRRREEDQVETAEYRVTRTFDHGGMHLAGSRMRAADPFAAEMVKAGYLVPINPAAGPPVAARPAGAETPEDRLPPATTPEDALRSEWAETGLKASPAVYLRRSPRGPRAALAKRLIEAGLGEG